MTTQERPDRSDISPRFREITDEVLFGDVWKRPILSPRERSIVVVSALTAQYRGDQLKRHIRQGAEQRRDAGGARRGLAPTRLLLGMAGGG